MEQSKDFSAVLDRDSVLGSIKKMELNISMFDSKIDTLTQEKQKVIREILACLAESGIEIGDGVDEPSFEIVLTHLQ